MGPVVDGPFSRSALLRRNKTSHVNLLDAEIRGLQTAKKQL
jgi:hypothetical protein